MNKCPNCGETSRIRDKDKFCHKCGCELKTGKMLDEKFDNQINVTAKVDMTDIDNTISKLEKLNELLKEANSLLNELTSQNLNISICM